jgi:hypothetical protein
MRKVPLVYNDFKESSGVEYLYFVLSIQLSEESATAEVQCNALFKSSLHRVPKSHSSMYYLRDA